MPSLAKAFSVLMILFDPVDGIPRNIHSATCTATWKQDIRHSSTLDMIQIGISLNSIGIRSLSSVQYKETDFSFRKFLSIGILQINSRMEMRNSSDCLRLGAMTWMPHIVTQGDPPNMVVTGTMLEVLDVFAHHLGFCYKLVFPRDLAAGAKLPNGSWTGVMRLLVDEEVSFTALALGINEDRGRDVALSEFLYLDEWTAAFRRPEIQSDITGFVRPYTIESWTMVMITTCITMIVSHIVRTLSADTYNHLRFQEGPIENENFSSIEPPAEGNKGKNLRLSSHFYESVAWTIGSLLAQAIPRTPRGESVRLLSGLWLLISLILATVYRSNLKAMLILPKVQLPFDNLEELVKSGIPVWTPTDAKLHETAIKSPGDTSLGRIKHQFVGVDAPTNIPWGIQGMHAGKFAFATPLSAISQIMHATFSKTGRCITYIMSEGYFKTSSLCLLLPKNSTWKNKLDPLIISLREGGILDHIYKKGIQNATECLKSPLSSSQGSLNLRPLDLGDFYGVFLVYVGGIAIVFLSFTLELISGGNTAITK